MAIGINQIAILDGKCKKMTQRLLLPWGNVHTIYYHEYVIVFAS